MGIKGFPILISCDNCHIESTGLGKTVLENHSLFGWIPKIKVTKLPEEWFKEQFKYYCQECKENIE